MSTNVEKSVAELEIVVDDGMKEIPIKNTLGKQIGLFCFRPTDVGIINRYNTLVSSFDAITEPLENANINANGTADDDASIAALNEAEQRLFKACDEMFGGNMSEAFFGEMHPFSPVNGVFFCETAIEAVGRFIQQQFGQETTKLNTRVKRYTNKYKKA